MDNSQFPAYPVARFDEDGQPFLDKKDSGLTKMEAFTMAAMQGLMSNPEVVKSADYGTHFVLMMQGEIVKEAIGIAKSTLTELSKHQ